MLHGGDDTQPIASVQIPKVIAIEEEEGVDIEEGAEEGAEEGVEEAGEDVGESGKDDTASQDNES